MVLCVFAYRVFVNVAIFAVSWSCGLLVANQKQKKIKKSNQKKSPTGMISRRILHKRYGHRCILVSNRINSLHTQASIVGAGLAGSLLAVYLRRRGYDVDVFEKLEDMRNCTTGGGRSINLILSSRGLHALDQVGLKEKVENITVPVYGRALHSVDGEVVMYDAFIIHSK